MELTFVIDNVTKRVVVDKKNDVYHFVIDEREYAVEAMPLANGSAASTARNSTNSTSKVVLYSTSPSAAPAIISVRQATMRSRVSS